MVGLTKASSYQTAVTAALARTGGRFEGLDNQAVSLPSAVNSPPVESIRVINAALVITYSGTNPSIAGQRLVLVPGLTSAARSCGCVGTRTRRPARVCRSPTTRVTPPFPTSCCPRSVGPGPPPIERTLGDARVLQECLSFAGALDQAADASCCISPPSWLSQPSRARAVHSSSCIASRLTIRRTCSAAACSSMSAALS